MLIENKNISANTPISIKLASGEEIIARYKEETSAALVITQPCAFIPTQDGKMSLAPWMITRAPDEKYNLNWPNIVTFGPTEKGIADVYLKATSKIQPASANDANVIDLTRR